MAGFDHGPAQPVEEEDMVAAARNANRGMALFLIYFAIYAGFVAINAFWPELAARPALWGVNVAIVYGFALIVTAIFLALVYSWLCRK